VQCTVQGFSILRLGVDQVLIKLTFGCLEQVVGDLSGIVEDLSINF